MPDACPPSISPRFDPASYPGPRPDGPVLVHDGRVHHLDLDGALPAPLRGDAAARDAPALRRQADLRWSVAYGSNASPPRLIDKGLDRDGAVLLPARLAGWEPAFEARRTSYGAVPLTLVPSAGAVIDTWLLGLIPDDLDELDRTEGRVPADRPGEPPPVDPTRHAPPGTYRLGRVGEVAVANRFVARDAVAYLPGPATRVQRTASGWRTWPAYDQLAAGSGVAGPSAPAPAPAAPVVGPWPPTSLEDLPLFVYGSLMPGAAAFARVADDVRVLGTVTAPGTLWDTGHGWPAARFRDGGGERVVGTLLAPRRAIEAATLLARLDRYEDVPELFRRVAIRVTAPTGPQLWALAYEWAGDTVPGRRLPDGRWSG